MRSTSMLGVVVVAFAANAGFAQQPATILDPADYMRAFFAAVTEERWIDAAAFVNLERLEQVRRSTMRFRRLPRAVPKMTPEEYMRLDSKMPRAVAEYQVAMMERVQAEAADEGFSFQFAGVRDTVELQRLTLLELGARWLQAQDQREELRRAYKRSGCAPKVPVEELLRAAWFPGRMWLERSSGAILRSWCIGRHHPPRASRTSLGAPGSQCCGDTLAAGGSTPTRCCFGTAWGCR